MANEQQNQPDVDTQATAETVADTDIATEEPVTAGKSLEAARAEIEELQAKVAEMAEQALRAQAEAQNARRRAEMDVEKAHKFALERFVNDLLPVADNLERAIASIDTGNEAFKAVTEGIELTLKAFLDTLKRHNVETVDPAGQPFDPQLHQAMSMVENANVEPNTVIDVFQKGYTLNGRLVRPAMVVVAKAPASPAA